jgi:hypothetical protein
MSLRVSSMPSMRGLTMDEATLRRLHKDLCMMDDIENDFDGFTIIVKNYMEVK